ncbi:beta-ketoacyl synthase N-terminal-like domain-containing protein [Sodalis-like endosymbiont of Proechinophthirus fluctus]|uniref:beta-ketoacyl synthase N-terminal-like domain-containing protein n=1 Tax=Sodalis-like endosymbiont of Proechinophthirus fluctus TaxID=1462730 RepID=UPI000AEDFD2E|nr:beta-ketoacyl synthase N-terminal-like domain-containing protein [Sodalis-like endosymbiont of Proechinophthirus fluctus]
MGGRVSPLGYDVETVWSRLLASKSGIHALPEDICELLLKLMEAFPISPPICWRAFPKRVVAIRDQKKMDSFSRLADAEEALNQSGWIAAWQQQDRTAIVIVTGIFSLPAIANAVRVTDSRGPGGYLCLLFFTIPSFISRESGSRSGFHYIQLQGADLRPGDRPFRRYKGHHRRCRAFN